jgi:hypothetical protein
MPRTWDAIVTDYESLAADLTALNVEARALAGGEVPPEPPPTGDVIYVEENLPQAIKDAPAGAVLDLGGLTFLATLVIDKPLTVQNGEVCAPGPNVNDLVVLKGEGITLRDLILRGEGSTKRGISNQAAGTVLERVEVRNICREGQETQAMAMWDSPGPLTATDCYFEAGSIGFLAGGSSPSIPNTIATGLTFTRCTFTRPLEWRDKAYACKNSFELKCARDVLVEDCEISNVWAQGQAGYLIQLTPSQYGNSPETVVDNVTFRRCHIHDGGNGVNMLGYTQHDEDDRQTQRGGNYRFEDCTFENILLAYEGQGAAVTCAHTPYNIRILDCSVHEDGGAFLRVSDKQPVETFEWRGGRVNVAGTYGVFSPLGSRGVAWDQIAPGGVIAGVTFVNAHSSFKANFPDNTYESA